MNRRRVVRQILEAYTGSKVHALEVVPDMEQQVAVRAVVTTRAVTQDFLIDLARPDDVEEVQFTQWPPVHTS